MLPPGFLQPVEAGGLGESIGSSSDPLHTQNPPVLQVYDSLNLEFSGAHLFIDSVFTEHLQHARIRLSREDSEVTKKA